MALNTLKLVTGDLEENCYIAWNEGSREAVIFDPGWNADEIRAELNARGLSIVAFLQTHCHGDHIGALTPLKQVFPAAPLYVPEAEKTWLARPTLNLSFFYGYSLTGPAPDVLVRDGDVIDAAGLSFKAIHVPGHSPGGTAYFIAPKNETPHLYCGDILFQGSIGRTDLPGGAGEEVLVEGIRSKLFVLPEETIVHPGHGDDTTIGAEKKQNPFCGTGR
ncbi:MAG TPA: MBL fold metallo-hydrolase [Planctomycetota bacterium]|nr:MBL fold metallo-hydrolase [Planctomycetota bacterium]